MLIGTRAFNSVEVTLWDVDFVQLTCYSGFPGSLERMTASAMMCKDAGIPYVVHPVGYSLLRKEMVDELKEMAGLAGIALILHDERCPNGRRLTGRYETQFQSTINELQSRTKVSFENSTDTGDVMWFWERYADSITLDIGHVEAEGLDSVEFVRSLGDETIKKIDYIHLHRNNGWHGGLTDHWHLLPDCRELEALKEFLKLKSRIGVILEINDTEMIEESLKLLKDLRKDLSL